MAQSWYQVDSSTTKFFKIVMHCELYIFRILFHCKIQSYSRAHNQKTKPKSNRQELISTIECYKDFHLCEKFLLSSAYSGVDPIVKKALAKRSEFSLIKADKVFILYFMTLGMDLVMMSHEKGML